MLNEACPICFLENENCTENTPLFINMDCGHSLCETCYNEWHIKQQNPSCVICRQVVIRPRNIRLSTSASPRPVLGLSTRYPIVNHCIYCKIGFLAGTITILTSGILMVIIKIYINNYFMASVGLGLCMVSLIMGLFVLLHHLDPALR